MTIQQVAELSEDALVIFVMLICSFMVGIALKVIYQSFSLKLSTTLDFLLSKESFGIDDSIEGKIQVTTTKDRNIREMKISLVKKYYNQPVYSKHGGYGVRLYTTKIPDIDMLYKNNPMDIPLKIPTLRELRKTFHGTSHWFVDKKIVDNDTQKYQYRIILECNGMLFGAYWYKNIDIIPTQEKT